MPTTTSPEAPALRTASLSERREILQRSPINARIWGLITAARELREGILSLLADNPEGDDPAVEALAAAGVARPKGGADFGAGAFRASLENLEGIAEQIAENLGCAVGEMPPSP
jgi:hypothetical protein